MKLTMRLGADSYDIVIKRGALGNLGQLTDLANRKVFIVTDTGVPIQYAETVKAQCAEYQRRRDYAVDAINAGDVVEIDFDRGVIIAGGKEYPFPPYPEFVQGLIKDGGLIPHVKKELGL